ncbi:MAG: 4Fe-4S dicluster domain-containing protein [Clostridia bacterium]|nr:4Fe-4S dicluster domain-containing protein [Clostridia bacterium]
MEQYKHSVLLDISRCKGCTNCLKRCPTEAIRIRNGHAVIDAKRCIDCGECIRVCPYKAKKASCDKLSAMDGYKWKIALPAPSLYGQFNNMDDVDYLLHGLENSGFDEVFEVSAAAELVTEYTRRYLHRKDIKKPVISSACPAVVRLISQRYPFLIDNILPILPPIEIAGKLAKERAMENHPELREEDICTCFISPCPAKVSYIKNKNENEKSYVDFVVSISDMYFVLLNKMAKDVIPPTVSSSGMIGIGWASTGGEATALFNEKYLAADGIENVIQVLEKIDNENFAELEYIELNACNGGCVGGVMTVENAFIAQARLQMLKRYLPVSMNRVDDDDEMNVPDFFFSKSDLEYEPVSRLGVDRSDAMRRMVKIENIFECLPAIDCGSCGSPTCRAFAEDVVEGEVVLDECVVRLRNIAKNLLEQKKKDDKMPSN